MQGGDGVAHAEVLCGEHAPDALHTDDIFGHRAGRLAGQGRVRVVRFQRGLPLHDARGPALGPADAKGGVEQRPHQGQQEGRDRPAQGRARVVFGK